MELGARDADFLVEAKAGFQPLVGEAHAVLRAAEILDLHLLELAGAEGEIARVDLVAERFSDLRDAEGQLHAVRIEHVLVLAENRLRGLRAEVGDLLAGGSEIRLEHQVELARLGEKGAVGGVVARGAGDLFGRFALELDGLDRVLFAHYGFVDELGIILAGGLAHLRLIRAGELKNGILFIRFPCGIRDGGSGEMIHRSILRFDLVGAQACVGKQAIAHRIAEAADVAGGLQHLFHGQDRTVHAEDVITFLHGLAPPVVLEVAFQFGSERAVVPAAVEASVKFSRLENKASAFAEGDDFLHPHRVRNILVCHKIFPAFGDAEKNTGGTRRQEKERRGGVSRTSPPLWIAAADTAPPRESMNPPQPIR